MRRSIFFLALAYCALSTAQSVQAQQPAAAQTVPPALTGSVAGYVFYDESKLPARFAKVSLLPIPTDADLIPVKGSPTVPGVASHSNQKTRVQVVSGSTGMDGSFRMEGLPAGDYLVAALKPGYVTPVASAIADYTIYTMSEDHLKSLIASLPQVHVASAQTASVNLTLHRGGVIAGRIHFADGSPAIAVSVDCDPLDDIRAHPDLRLKAPSLVEDALQSVPCQFTGTSTDDEGRYRIAGLSPGRYLLFTKFYLDHSPAKVVLSDGSSPPSYGREYAFREEMFVYEPGTFRRKDARIFEILADEQILDADVKLDPDGLHSLKGKVFAAEDHHAPDWTIVRLREAGTKESGRLVFIEVDGSFQINYLPPGNYTLEIGSARGGVNSRGYKTVTVAAIVGEHDVVLDDVLMTALKPGEKNPDSIF